MDVANLDLAGFAACIDQTLLAPTADIAGSRPWIEENAARGFASLCVTPVLLPSTVELLSAAGSTTRACSVCGFPLGYSATETKAAEARMLVAAGCAEVDMVIAVGELLGGHRAYVERDISTVVEVVAGQSAGVAIVKVILETGYLSEDDIAEACKLVEAAGAHFVKTSTGFGPRGASLRDVELMRGVVGGRLGIKAAGGIRDLDSALAFLDAGATRLGTSSGGQLLEAFAARSAG